MDALFDSAVLNKDVQVAGPTAGEGFAGRGLVEQGGAGMQ